MILGLLGSVNTMVKREWIYHHPFLNYISEKEGMFWPKLPGTPLKQAYFGSSIQEILKQEKVILKLFKNRPATRPWIPDNDHFREKFLNSLHGALSILSVTLIQMESIELLQIKLQFILSVSMLTKGLKSQNGNMDQTFMSFVVH